MTPHPTHQPIQKRKHHTTHKKPQTHNPRPMPAPLPPIHCKFLKLMYTGLIVLPALSSFFITPNSINRFTIFCVFPNPIFPLTYAISLIEGLNPYLFHHSSITKNTSLCAGLIPTPIHSSYVLSLFLCNIFVLTNIRFLTLLARTDFFKKSSPPSISIFYTPHPLLPRNGRGGVLCIARVGFY